MYSIAIMETNNTSTNEDLTKVINDLKKEISDIKSNELVNIKKRSTKKTLYKEERNKLLNEIINIMNLDENNSILSIELENNQKLKDKLLNSINDIKKYYRCSSWGYFVSENNDEKGNHISLLRAIFKDHGYSIYSKKITCEYNRIKQRYVKLLFGKKNE